MILKSYKVQYLLWAFLLAICFGYETYATSGIGDKQLIGSFSVRFLYEFSVVLVFFSLLKKNLKPVYLFPLSAFTYFLIWQEWIDNGFKLFVYWMDRAFDIVIPVYPQMGLMILAGIGISISLACICIGRKTSFRLYSLFILFAFTSFHGLAHWQALTNLNDRTGLILDGYKMLTVSNLDTFRDVCERTQAVCYYGKYTHDLKLYKNIYRSPANKDVPEHTYYEPKDFDGVKGINDFASTAPVLAYTWSTNYLKFPTIDSPLKFVSYQKYADDVYILIDDNSYLKTKQGVINLLKPFLFGFGVIWVIGGMGVFLMHERRRLS